MPNRDWSTHTRLLHWAIALTVTFQLFSSLFMADTGTQYLFPIHEYVGMLASLAVLVFWLHAFAVYELPILFPWNGKGFRAVKEETLGLLRRRLPEAGRRVGLSSFIHGLGLLALSGNALTGVILFSMVPPGHHAAPSDTFAFTRYSLDHKFFGDLLWVYWFGHVGFALLHQFAGDNVLGKIFGTRRNEAPEQEG